MKRKTKTILRGLAKHFGLKVKFVNYFGDEIHGKLLVREKRILINANKARCEHVFTLLHEIGHYALHFKKHARNRHRPWFLNLNVNNDFIAGLISKLRRQIRFIYNKQSGKEWEADLWAMCAMLYLAKYTGHSDLLAFIERHPEKSSILWLAVSGSIYAGVNPDCQSAWRPDKASRAKAAAIPCPLHSQRIQFQQTIILESTNSRRQRLHGLDPVKSVWLAGVGDAARGV